MPDPAYKALCAELVDVSDNPSPPQYKADVLNRARAALAQPEPEVPTDEDRPMPAAIRDMPEQQQRWYALGWRAALARYGRPAIEPVPVSERLPGPEDCTADEECWYWDLISGCWFFLPGRPLNDHYSHWLPHWALPVPGVEGADA